MSRSCGIFIASSKRASNSLLTSWSSPLSSSSDFLSLSLIVPPAKSICRSQATFSTSIRWSAKYDPGSQDSPRRLRIAALLGWPIGGNRSMLCLRPLREDARFPFASCPHKVDEASFNVQTGELDLDLVTHIDPLVPATSFPSTGGFSRRTQVPFSEAPVTRASKVSPMRPERNCAAADFRT